MHPEKYQQAKTIFEVALAISRTEQNAFLQEACGKDEELLALVKSLLEADAQDGSFLQKPLLEIKRSDPYVGQQIDRYKILKLLGYGGMGAVYLAARDDEQFKKRVALKLVKAGMDNERIIERFRNERQILAGLSHPYIAHLLDGGATKDGLPYFVMEYVEGLPIDKYCDSHKLNTTERLQLFRKVCEAVHYAHQNLIVHRDLKPGNILVTSEGVPKLLDFGIAKLLNPNLAMSSFGATLTVMQMMTPEYASPEQVRGEPITTASDVYSLGVLLYELLTGHRPYRLKNRVQQEIARVICEQEPDKPSTAISRVEEIVSEDGKAATKITPELISRTREGRPEVLHRRLAGDIDNIALMALRKESQRRYSSVEKLSEDIRRHIEGLPVIARKDTAWYRSQKFVSRHRGLVAAAALIALALIGGIVGTAWQARIAQAERMRAEKRFNDVRKLANSFLFEFNDAIAKIPGTTKAQELVVKKALEYLDNLAQESGPDRALQSEVATAYEKVSFIQWNRYYANLGDVDGSLASQRKALEIRSNLATADPANAQYQIDFSKSLHFVGDLLIAKQDITAALEYYQKTRQIRERLFAADSANAQIQFLLAVSYQRLGDTMGNPGFQNLGKTDEALANYQKMMALFGRLLANDPANAERAQSLAIGYEKIGDISKGQGDLSGALENYLRDLAIMDSLHAKYPNQARYKRDAGIIRGKVGEVFETTNKIAEAKEYHQKSFILFKELQEADPEDARAMLHFSWMLNNLVRISIKTGSVVELHRYTKQLLETQKSRADKTGASAQDLNNYAWALLTCEAKELRDPAVALQYAKRAVEITQEKEPNFMDTLALAYYMAGKRQRAIEIETKALSLLPPDSSLRAEFEANLEKFKAGQKF